MNKCIFLLVLAAVCVSARADWVCWGRDGKPVNQLVSLAGAERSPMVTGVQVGGQFSVTDVGADGGYATVAICVDKPSLIQFLGERNAAPSLLVGGRPIALDGGAWFQYVFKALKPGKVNVLVMSERKWSHEKASRITKFDISRGVGRKNRVY